MSQTTLSSDRLPAPDLIRGIALIGIGAENILSFDAANEHIATYAALFPDPVNKLLLAVFMLFLRGKFYPVFALLFGFGMALSLAQRGKKPFFRRNFFIGALGFTQLLFIWNGDVLLQYAFLGLLLFFLKELPAKFQLFTAGLFFLLSFLLPGFLPQNHSVSMEIAAQVYAESSFTTLFKYRIPAFFQGIATAEFGLFLSRILAFMLLGYLLGRNNNYRKFLEVKTAGFVLLIALITLLICGLLLQFTGLRGDSFRPLSQEIFKSTLVALFFLANVLVIILLPLLLILKLPNLRFWQSFIALGRLTLTHYLLQNLLFSFVFYGYGLGWYLQISLLQLWFGYMVLIVIQALVSIWWLKYFKQGPVEKLLRKFAYA